MKINFRFRAGAGVGRTAAGHPQLTKTLQYCAAEQKAHASTSSQAPGAAAYYRLICHHKIKKARTWGQLEGRDAVKVCDRIWAAAGTSHAAGLGLRTRIMLQWGRRKMRGSPKRTFSLEGRPRSTSGAAYMNVPAKAWHDEKNSARDRPMSDTLACPSSVSRMLPGLTSLQRMNVSASARVLLSAQHC